MRSLLFQDILQAGHLISDEATSLLAFQAIDLPLVILDLLIHVFQLLLNDIRRGLRGDQLILLLNWRPVLLLVEHLVDFDYLVFQLAVSLLQLLDVLRPE
jgi:hypothetical protein